MTLSTEKVAGFIQMIVSVEPDSIGCDECFGRVAEFAEAQISQHGIPDGFEAIERHLQQCPCCRDEYRALLEGLQAMAAENP